LYQQWYQDKSLFFFKLLEEWKNCVK
jgi:hypothetical protein